MSEPIKVITYTDALGVGGAEISLGHLISTVSDEFEMTTVGVSESVIHSITQNSSNSSKVILSNQGLRGFVDHLRTFQTLKPQIIHCNLCSPWACSTALAAALCLPDVRVVQVNQLPLRTTHLPTWLRTRLLSLRVDAQVAVGVASSRRLEDFYALGRDSVISIPNGVPDRVPVPPLPSSGQQMTVASVGRLDAMKAHEILLRAIAQVDNVSAFILGDGELRPVLTDLTRQLGLGDRVRFLGWVENPRDYLAECDGLVMPSRSEGFPLAMVEAMLAARPVIATRVGSMPEAVIDGQTGLLIEKNDVAGLVQALQQLRDRPDLRRTLGMQARQMAVSHFTVAAMTTSYQNLWRTLVNRPPVSRLWVSPLKD
ncbi:MAG: glycosyltransferase [Leptolyngbyaceae cyanobacterium bins.349]|nr:glycosyltransferase [Leptolyngbyaceae cyanobacterium bins.349]